MSEATSGGDLPLGGEEPATVTVEVAWQGADGTETLRYVFDADQQSNVSFDLTHRSVEIGASRFTRRWTPTGRHDLTLRLVNVKAPGGVLTYGDGS